MATKKFSNTREVVYQILERMLDMREGQVAMEQTNSERACTSIRSLLYRELKNKGLTSIFTIKRVGKDVLAINRVGRLASTSSLAGSDKDLEAFILKNLLEVYEELEAFTLIRGGLPQHQWGSALDEWKRIVGTNAELC